MERAINFIDFLTLIKSTKVSVSAQNTVFMLAVALWGTSIWVKKETDIVNC